MTEADIYGDDDSMWHYHTKNNPGLKTSIFDTMLIFAKSLLGDFKDNKDKYFKLRYLQYEWVRISLEQLRREAWFSSGMIYWMLNDCWPAASGWSLIDYYGLPKDALYAFKRCSSRLVISFDKDSNGIKLYAASKCNELTDAHVKIYLLTEGKVKTVDEFTVREIPDGSRVIRTYEKELLDTEVLIADIECGEERDRTFYKNGALKIVPSDAKLSVDKASGTLTVMADSYVHAIELTGECELEDNCFSLLPGEERTVRFFAKADTDIKLTAYTLEL